MRFPPTEFKARCLAILQAIHDGRSPSVLVTKHGKPLARISATGTRSASIGGWWTSAVTISGDLTEPSGDAWEAEPRV